ncbi:hypothetical protein N322_08605 [Cariama cristata]|nr:hypothetical protein N322_08605 [Cariama cristata]
MSFTRPSPTATLRVSRLSVLVCLSQLLRAVFVPQSTRKAISVPMHWLTISKAVLVCWLAVEGTAITVASALGTASVAVSRDTRSLGVHTTTSTEQSPQPTDLTAPTARAI